MKRAQASLELMILIGFLLLSFAIFLLTIQAHMSDSIKERGRAEITEVATAIQTEIELATKSIDGYKREFKTPTTQYLGAYTISINESILFIESEDSEYIYSLAVENITGQPIRGTNIIEKQNGNVLLNQ